MVNRRLSCLALLVALASPALAADAPTYGEKLEGFDYAWPVKHFTFTSQHQPLVLLPSLQPVTDRYIQDKFTMGYPLLS